MKKIYLASTSSNRKKLLEQVGLEFKTISADYQEDMSLALSPTDLAAHLAEGKAEAACKQLNNGIVIAADTIAVTGRMVLGKPRDEEHAKIMLTSFSGRCIDSITGICVVDVETRKKISKSVTTKVYFKKLSEEEIDNYIESDEAVNRAGAFAIQGLGAVLIEKIEGDFNTIVGLPISTLYEVLKEFDIKIL